MGVFGGELMGRITLLEDKVASLESDAINIRTVAYVSVGVAIMAIIIAVALFVKRRHLT